MMGTWGTLLEYCTSKPPIIVFFISIMTFALTLAGLSISIEVNKGKLFNPDIRSWNSFYNSVSQLGVCYNSKNQSTLLNEITEQSTENEDDSQEVNETKVSFISDVALIIEGVIPKTLSIRGFVKSEDLGYSDSSSEIEIIIRTLTSSSNKNQTCLTVSGPVDQLPNANTPRPLCNVPKNPSVETVTFMPYWKVEDKVFCPSGQYGKLSIQEREELNVYISDKDSSLIQLHILFTSTVLCVAMTAILLCAMFGRYCKREKNINSEIEKNVLVPGR